jgi:CRP/FNR family cyclic AMP-dependent transcriptional regulator
MGAFTTAQLSAIWRVTTGQPARPPGSVAFPWRVGSAPALLARGGPRAGTVRGVSALVAIEERKKLLNDVWLFHGATDEELTMLAERAYEVSVGPQVDIVTQSEFGDELFLVVDGHATVSRDGTDLGVVNPGDFFGEMALLGTGVRTSTVRSIVAMTLLGLRAEHFDEVLVSEPMVARRVLSVVVRRLEATDRRLAELEGRGQLS